MHYFQSRSSVNQTFMACTHSLIYSLSILWVSGLVIFRSEESVGGTQRHMFWGIRPGDIFAKTLGAPFCLSCGCVKILCKYWLKPRGINYSFSAWDREGNAK